MGERSSTEGSSVRWGVLGAAKIARNSTIPAFERSPIADVVAIASRDEQRAGAVARELGIPTAHGSYEALLADPSIDAVYIPLPNHLHKPWTIRALEAGKHVLCEKPLGLNAAEVEEIGAVADRTGRRAMEAFMYRFHPQWQTVDELIEAGTVGDIRLVAAWFSYPPNDPSNVRYVKEWGGGALMDVGCYCIDVARRTFGGEPESVSGVMKLDPRSGVDVLTTGTLDFGTGQAMFSCGIEQDLHQRVTIIGTAGSIAVTMPFNPLPDTAYDIVVRSRGDERTVTGPIANQFTKEIDAFSASVLAGNDPPLSLAGSAANMRVIDAVAASA